MKYLKNIIKYYNINILKKSVAYAMLGIMFCTQALVVPAYAFLGLDDFGMKEEAEAGQRFNALIRCKLPIINDPEVAVYMHNLLKKISSKLPPQPFPFSIDVVSHDSLNAFAVPGGYIFVFSGLIMQLEKEGELAGIIAHEMAHVTQRHVAARIEKSKYINLATLLVAVAGLAATAGGPNAGGGAALASGAFGAGQSAMLSYSRMDENEADHLGYQYMLSAGYPPIEMAGGFKKIQAKTSMSGNSSPAYLSTHPDIDERIVGIVTRAQTAPKAYNNRTYDNTNFIRAKTLMLAKYGNIKTAWHQFSQRKTDGALAYMGKGILLNRENNITEAKKAFDKAVSLAPNDSLILREAGTFNFLKGDTTKANTLLSKAMSLNPQDYMATFYYARLLDETGQGHKAMTYYNKVLKTLPEDSEVHNAYGRSLGNSGKTFEAYIHLAYGALYANNPKNTKRFHAKAKELAKSTTDKTYLQKFEQKYEERKEFWGVNA